MVFGIFAIGIGSGYVLDRVRTRTIQKASVADAIKNAPTDTETQTDQTTTTTNTVLTLSSLPEVKLIFTGDMLIDSSIKSLVKNKLDGDYEKIFGAAETILQKADITFGTFNGTFSATDTNRTETKAAVAMRNAGFDVLGTNYGGINRASKSLIETTLVIDGNGLTHTGAGRSYLNARLPVLIEKNGVTVGYLALTDSKNDWPLATENEAGLLWANDPQLEEIIAAAKAKADVLVVSFNWAETATTHTLRQELLAHTAIDAGATIVVGHHGSNLHDLEYYHGGIIAYNLGQLISSSGPKSGIHGLIFETGIRGGVINTVAAYGVVANTSGYIDSVAPVSMESLVREKGVTTIATPDEIINALPESIASEIVSHGPHANKVAITIDDGWSPTLVKQALDVLSTKSAKATFFTVGSIVDANRLNFIRAVTNGIELGNHTDTHGWLTQMNDTTIAKEMAGWQTKTDAALGTHYEVRWFRPPFMAGFAGHSKTAESVTSIAKANGMRIALWNVDPFSGISTRADVPTVTNYIINSAKPGSIILLHFTQEHIAALPAIIDGLRAKGLEPVTMSELMNLQ